jgi:hypothetical protein
MPVVVIARFPLARQQLRNNAYATKRTAENRSNQTVASDLGGNAIRIQEPEENPMQRGCAMIGERCMGLVRSLGG